MERRAEGPDEARALRGPRAHPAGASPSAERARARVPGATPSRDRVRVGVGRPGRGWTAAGVGPGLAPRGLARATVRLAPGAALRVARRAPPVRDTPAPQRAGAVALDPRRAGRGAPDASRVAPRAGARGAVARLVGSRPVAPVRRSQCAHPRSCDDGVRRGGPSNRARRPRPSRRARSMARHKRRPGGSAATVPGTRPNRTHSIPNSPPPRRSRPRAGRSALRRGGPAARWWPRPPRSRRRVFRAPRRWLRSPARLRCSRRRR
jgi:hypothetical protein